MKWIALLVILVACIWMMLIYRRRWLDAEAIINSASRGCPIYRDDNGIIVHVDMGPEHTTFEGIDPVYSSWFDRMVKP